MSKISKTDRQARRGRVLPDLNYSPEELARIEAEMQHLIKQCEQIFQEAKPKLIDDYYDWFMVIEPDSGDYFIDKDDKVAEQKADEKYPDTRCVVYRINETGACYRV